LCALSSLRQREYPDQPLLWHVRRVATASGDADCCRTLRNFFFHFFVFGCSPCGGNGAQRGATRDIRAAPGGSAF
jgi:hypothetical protein